jgi:hypothetical protein
VRAVSVATTPEAHEHLERRWARFPKLTEGIRLVILDYDFRDILTPLVDYIKRVNTEEFPGEMITIVVPEFLPEHSGAQILHNQTARLLRSRLRHEEDIVIIDVPYHIHEKSS